jgi:hypothetical protein
MGSALVFLGAVGFTLVAAYQWAGSVGGFGSTTTEFAVRDCQSRAWSTAVAHIGPSRGAPHSRIASS